MPAAADVIYSNLKDIAIPATFAGVYLDVDTGNWNTSDNAPQTGWDINPFFGGLALGNSPDFQPVRSGTGAMNAVLNLAVNTTVGVGSVFSTFTQGPEGENPGGPGYGASETHLGNGVGQFVAGNEGYLGFRTAVGNYGWMRVIFTNNTSGAMIKDWAYDTSGSAISVGGIVQIGQNITLSSASTLGSALTNSGGTTNLLKNSVGTSTLTATNTYSGTTTVSTGTLAVNGAGSINTSSGVTINGGTFRYNASTALSPTVTFTSGTLAGTNWNGSLGGLSVGTDQAIAPGNSTGTATTTSQIWAGGGTYQFEINNATGTAGSTSGWDLLTGTGSLDIDATNASKFNIAVTSLGLNQIEGDAVGFNNMVSYNWLIADFASVLDFATNAFSIDTTNFSNDFSGAFGIARGDSISGGDSSQIYLTYSLTPIPEPRSILLVALGSLALLRRRRS